ncbi:T9SS type A sorting domain-containing protein [Psychroserpens mesophilus]|uniref:T9SS type A sorting domain-containing protein n=1 Tax=Psychroserpens mesophilus TaxID=325473 RepID=UPI000A043B78|nr:T9SS type A sorting domain-containing protein [Psychroserpens mesophilus]
MKQIYTSLVVFLLLSGMSFSQQIIHNVDSNNSAIHTDFDETSNDVVTEQNTELVYMTLRANTSNASYSTDVFFNANATLGFDLGYDASFFGALPEFVIFSELVEDNTGLPLVLQAVNSNDVFGVSIPIGVNANQGQQITFALTNSTLPDSINIFLDDTTENTSTLLNTSNYVITPTTNLSGTGRFFLRTSLPSVTYTYTDGVWTPNNPIGIATAIDDIIVASGDLTLASDLSVNTVTVNPGTSLTINSDVTLTANNGLQLKSNSTSYSSLIRNGLVNGTLSYERHVNINGSGSTGSNDLISAPFTGQPFNAFAAANSNILSNTENTLYLFGPFDKATGTYLTYSNTETATLEPGVGYRAASNDNNTFTFVGLDNLNDVSIDIVNSGPNNAEWNLIGNPYPAYLNVQQFLLHDVGGVANFQLFDAPTAAIYGYDGSALNGWTIYNLATITASTVIAPGQGFFVSADATNSSLYNLEFTPEMRSAGTSDDFIAGRNSQLTYLKLNLNATAESFSTDFYFNTNASAGFDLGYDAQVWGGVVPEFGIYSHLVEDNAGLSIALQALNISDLADTSIPLGIHANQGEQLTFSIANSTLPESVNIYLDDVVANTSTLLNNSDYVMTPNTNLSGTGRFFLRTSEDALSTFENNLSKLTIYAINNSNDIVVNGRLENHTQLDLHDIQGRLVMRVKLDNAVLQNHIDVTSLQKGVYIVNIYNNTQQKTQKVIIN